MTQILNITVQQCTNQIKLILKYNSLLFVMLLSLPFMSFWLSHSSELGRVQAHSAIIYVEKTSLS